MQITSPVSVNDHLKVPRSGPNQLSFLCLLFLRRQGILVTGGSFFFRIFSRLFGPFMSGQHPWLRRIGHLAPRIVGGGLHPIRPNRCLGRLRHTAIRVRRRIRRHVRGRHIRGGIGAGRRIRHRVRGGRHVRH